MSHITASAVGSICHMSVRPSVCRVIWWFVCVCVRERERESERHRQMTAHRGTHRGFTRYRWELGVRLGRAVRLAG